MAIEIRTSQPDDVSLIHGFIKELAAYEKLAHEAVASEADIRDTLFDAESKARCLIAELDGEAIGFALYFYNYSTFLGRYGIYLEDLYVRESHRGYGAGKALLTRLAEIAVSENCGRLEWSVLNWNQPAIDFYKSLGAKPQDEWTVYRLTGEALRKLGGGGA